MRKPVIAFTLALAIAPSVAIAAANHACLRTDQIDRINMTGTNTAIARDTHGRRFGVTFVSPCGVRHIGVFFISNPDNMQTCLGPGAGIRTNTEGASVVKSIESQS